MKKIIFILIATMLFFTGCKTQQDPVEKTAQETEQTIWGKKAMQALSDKKFVLETDQIEFRKGKFAYVDARKNFISMHDDKTTIQMAFNSAYAAYFGSNGIGGVTFEGNASNIRMETDKKGNATFRMVVIGRGISSNVVLKIMKGTNKCYATITPNNAINYGKMVFSGNLLQESDSDVFKGRVLY